MKPLTIDGVIDIETEDWDIFVVGEVLHSNGTVFVSDNPNDFYQYIRALKGMYWAHNSGRFDGLWLMDMALKCGDHIKIQPSGSRATSIQIGNLILRDSYALVPLKLASFSEMAEVRKSETNLPCICGDNCGGYCSIRRDMDPRLYKLLLEYLHNDCLSLYQSLCNLFGFAAANGFTLRGTLGASAWESARVIAGLPVAVWSPSQYYLARKGYYGGRCQVFRAYANEGHRYDINSAYPAALTKDIPIGDTELVAGQSAARCWDRGYDGVYQATVDIPSEEWIPPLPYHMPNHGRVAYPIGKVTGYWTGIELANAYEHGAHILDFGVAIIWRDSAPAVKPFIDIVWPLRFKVGKSTAMGTWLKLFANSLTGKFAQDPDGERIVLNPRRDEIKACKAKPPCSVSQCSGKCGAWHSIDMEGRVWIVPRWDIAKCAHIHWAAQLTARTRVTLYNQLSAGDDDAIYCDTDSCYSIGKRFTNIGMDLGQWGYDGPLYDWKAIAPKAYKYADETSQTRVRCKGLGISNPRGDTRRASVENFERYANGIPVSRAGVASLKTAARSGDRLFLKHGLTRASKNDGQWSGDRRVDESSGLTYPVTIEEQLARKE